MTYIAEVDLCERLFCSTNAAYMADLEACLTLKSRTRLVQQYRYSRPREIGSGLTANISIGLCCVFEIRQNFRRRRVPKEAGRSTPSIYPVAHNCCVSVANLGVSRGNVSGIRYDSRSPVNNVLILHRCIRQCLEGGVVVPEALWQSGLVGATDNPPEKPER